MEIERKQTTAGVPVIAVAVGDVRREDMVEVANLIKTLKKNHILALNSEKLLEKL